MLTSANHEFKKPERTDDVLLTIDGLQENFEKLDGLVDESATSLTSFLVEGKEYSLAKRIWNGIPVVGGNVGWVNIRTGKYAPTWQERTTYSLGDLVMPDTNNGHVYQCIENGTSGVIEPIFPTTTGNAVFDNTGRNTWIGNYVYNVDDIVIATSGSELYHYRCIAGGTSDTTEPTWSTSSGVTIVDGTVTWQAYKTVKWKEVGVSCEFREFGNIL